MKFQHSEIKIILKHGEIKMKFDLCGEMETESRHGEIHLKFDLYGDIGIKEEED